MGLGPKWYQIGNTICYIPKVRKCRISMSTGLKMSSLVCKCAFYRAEHNAKEGPHWTEFWGSWNVKMKYTNIYSSKSRWKKWVICLVINYTPGAMVIKMSKIAHFLYFLLMPAKNQSQFGQNIYVHLKDLCYIDC